MGDESKTWFWGLCLPIRFSGQMCTLTCESPWGVVPHQQQLCLALKKNIGVEKKEHNLQNLKNLKREKQETRCSQLDTEHKHHTNHSFAFNMLNHKMKDDLVNSRGFQTGSIPLQRQETAQLQTRTVSMSWLTFTQCCLLYSSDCIQTSLVTLHWLCKQLTVELLYLFHGREHNHLQTGFFYP